MPCQPNDVAKGVHCTCICLLHKNVNATFPVKLGVEIRTGLF